ncbi:putative surface-exposed protein [Escherichia coli TA280]|nr:putative surface-exposed protein [Escherichia coli TA280]
MTDNSFHIKRVSRAVRQVLGLSLLLPVAASAVTPPPGAGTLDSQMRQAAPAVTLPALSTPELTLPAAADGQAGAPADDGTRITLKHIMLTGDKPGGMARVSEGKIRKILDGYTGRALSFGDLQELTSVLTGTYRSHGALLARVIIPPQTIRDGLLTLTLLPGKYDTSRVSGGPAERDGVLINTVSRQSPEGDIITRQKLERLALLVNEMPGVQGQVSLKTGSLPGTAAVDVVTRPGQKAGGYVGMDNLGTQVTGRSRVTGGAFVNGLFLTGDQLRFDGALSYEKEGLTNARAGYSLPAGGYGTRLGVDYSRLDYEYNFMQQSFSGYSDNWEAWLTHPLIRTSGAQVNLRLAGGQSYLTDRYPGIFALLGEEGRKTVTTGTAGVVGSFATLPGGVTGLGLDITRGDMHYRDDSARFWSGSDLRNTEGSFTTLNWQFRHEQQVYGPVSLLASAHGQVADRNLDSSRKLMLGGPSAVRAYDVGDGSVDSGVVATGELRTRWALPSWQWSGRAPELTVSGFYDYGRGDQNRNNTRKNGQVLAEPNAVELAGAGMSVTLSDAGNYAVTATWARRTTGADPVSGNRDSERVWLSAVKTF